GDQDVAAMNEALCDVQKTSVRQRLIEAGLKQAARFSWHTMAQTVSNVLLATIQGLKTEQPKADHSTPVIFAGAMAPQWRHWLYQACQFLLTQGETPTEGKVCTSASDLDNYLSLMQPSEKTRLIGYRFWGDLSQKYLAQSHHRHVFLYGDPLKLAAEELSQGKTPFSHILLELWLTQGDNAWLNQRQTHLLNFSQLLERPKPIIKEISNFLGLTTTKKTLQELLSVHPLPAPKQITSSKGFGSKLSPISDPLPPAQQLLLMIFLRPSRLVWFSTNEEDYDQRLGELFETTPTEAWQKIFQDTTELLVDHLGDRLGDWLKTAHDHGVLALRLRNPQGAAQLLFILGEQLRERGKEREAKPFYQEAIKLNPQEIQALLALGKLTEAEKKDTEAMTYYQQALHADPNNAKSLLSLANLNRVQKNFSQAEVYLERILRQNPQDQLARYWLVKTLEQKGEITAAKDRFSEEEIELLQNLTSYLSSTGGKAFDEKNYEFAKDCYHLALEIDDHNYSVYFNLALIATKEKRPQQAIRYYQKSLTLKPEHPEALVNLAALFSQRGEFQEGIALLNQALKLDEQNSMAYHNLAICYVYQGRLKEAVVYANQAVQNCPENPLYHSHLLANLSAMKEVSSEDLVQVSQVWYDNHVVAKGLSQCTQYPNVSNSDRPLRIGFVSGDFKRHSVSFFMKPIFEHHHPDQIQIYAYAQVEDPDDFTETLKDLCEQWRDTLDLDDAALASQIQQDQIDILVDLSGHTLLNRLAVFGMKPAPIQATYLGYPATTGLPTIDYWITDHYIHPPETTETAVEEIWRLPRCYISYSPPPVAPPIGPLPQTHLGVITFGSFNASRKLTPETVQIWSEILKQVPESRLLLKCSDPRYSPQLMIESFLKLGIEHQRVIVYRNSPYQDHLNLYNQVDLHLDPMPYTGCTTTCEALWMGVPTLTLAGQKKMERMSTTILTTVGLDDFITTNSEDYIAKAVQFVARPDYLALLRQTLRQRLQASALLDGEDLTQALETAFRQMWQRYLSTKKS
ncbi:MAG: hypothetical protein RLZZ490_1360, partial [Cyanobacteriota bacterium]